MGKVPPPPLLHQLCGGVGGDVEGRELFFLAFTKLSEVFKMRTEVAERLLFK